MRLALYHPRAGYYAGASASRAGPEGDFVTAPTTTPLFGAALARFVAAAWTRLGKPLSWSLIEVGAGTGALAGPMIAALRKDHGAAAHGMHVTLVDANPTHREVAARRLQTEVPALRCIVTSELPKHIPGPTIVIANELLDNLPVRLLARQDGKWMHRCVGLDAKGAFTFVDEAAPQTLVSWAEAHGISSPDNHQVEVCCGAEEWLNELNAHLGDPPAVVLLIDYGETARDLFGEPRPTGTLTAFHAHKQDKSVLEAPGTKDITSHVNWTAVARHANSIGFDLVGYTQQSSFLTGLGLMDDVAQLAGQVTSPESMATFHAAKEILVPGGLGERFKVMALTKGLASTPDWPGFQDARPVDPRPRSAP